MKKLRQKITTFVYLLRYRRNLVSHLRMTGFFLDSALSVNFGSLTSEEEGGIREAVRRAGIHPGPFVEIGSLFGFTTNLIALLKEPERELIGLDNLSWNPLGL